MEKLKKKDAGSTMKDEWMNTRWVLGTINGSIQTDGNKNDVTVDLIRDAKNAILMFLSIVFSQISFW